ncbi:hypothetical protein QTH14_07380 [Clostridium perfringens]|uniref:hypothetical protein n=1 Tax=Clostridium perfringens TaxID=1502 RepID=UPI001A30755B|nr:hypothetical protein [Clostridium perfringens]MDK0728145.1 hypothetical protein [Clostridium perfringens]MDM0565682.1 hypothetical protein [Clostridium perfringens]MDM0574869.1 hypothetical protein [Clostridium perfringens]HAT4268122.1 hypothetical protein [Clostridium perfringens]
MKGEKTLEIEKFLIELYGRIKNLEERVAKLESENNYENKSENKITRKVTRQYVIEKLQEENLGLYARKGSKDLNADILIDLDKKSLKVKYLHSKSYNNDFPAGWYTLSEDDINNEIYDLFIFCIDFKGDFKTFLFTKNEINEIVNCKSIDAKKNYHFYIHMKENGRILECRDDDIDIKYSYERWNLPVKLVSNN